MELSPKSELRSADALLSGPRGKLKCNDQFQAKARWVPLLLMKMVKDKLTRMEHEDIIENVTQLTKRCATPVPMLNPSGDVCICVDLKKLNQAVKFVVPTIQEVISKLSGAKVFTSLEVASRYYQIPLYVESSKLTNFITPFDKYCFKRISFGSSPEIFKRKMTEIVQGPGRSSLLHRWCAHWYKLSERTWWEVEQVAQDNWFS